MNSKHRINHTKVWPIEPKILFASCLIAATFLSALHSAALAETGVAKKQGNLAFTKLEKEVILEIGETSKETVFEFTNLGKKSIRIVGIKSSCGCTVPELVKKEYAPGEAGSLKVSFKASTGVQNTSGSILLVSDEDAENFYTLKLIASRKQAALLSSQREEWKLGSIPEARDILVNIAEDGTHIIEASSSNDAFDVKMTTVEAGKQYKVTVMPRTSDYPAAASLRLQTTNEKQPFLIARLEVK